MKSTKKQALQNAVHKLRILGLGGLLAGATALGMNANAQNTKGKSSNGRTKTKTEIKAKTQKKANKPTYVHGGKNIDKSKKPTHIDPPTKSSPFDKSIMVPDDFESFKKNVWDIYKPYCVPVLILSENWRPDFHNDRQNPNAAPNSVGVGMYNMPLDRKFNTNTGKWGTTKSYVIKYKQNHRNANPKSFTPQEMRDGIYGWCAVQDNGSNLHRLHKVLKGVSLTPNEFAAIYSRFFHTGNLNVAEAIVKIKKDPTIKNADKPLLCARKFLSAKTSLPGQKSRFMHEALVYLNVDNYCNDLFGLCVDCHLGTAINACPEEYNNVRGNKLTIAKAKTIKQKICKRVVPKGKTVESLCKTIKDKKIIDFNVDTQMTEKMSKRNELYQEALALYYADNPNYKKVQKLLLQVIQQEGESPDLYNDLAVTYRQQKEYNSCITTAQKVFKFTGAEDEFCKASFEIGQAYEAQANYTKALKAYKDALKYYNKYSVADADPNVKYAKIYTKAIERMETALKTKTKQQSKAKTQKEKAKKTAAKQQAKKPVAKQQKKAQPKKSQASSKAKQNTGKNKTAQFDKGRANLKNKLNVHKAMITKNSRNGR